MSLLDKRGAEFERFFTAVSIEMWGDDFEPWKPQGRLGDFKCDGYRVSDKLVFQCNAPEQFVARDVEGKILEDFAGALAHFGDRMERWIFVHNQKETPARANEAVHQLRQQHPDIDLRIWTSGHLASEVLKLSDGALQNLFGFIGGQELSDEMKDFLAKEFDQATAPVPPQQEAVVALINHNGFDDAMDNLGEIDREIRRRLLGYSLWLDPATKVEVNARIEGRGFEAGVIAINAQRLHEAQLINITENHYLPVAAEVCQQAADTLTEEFLLELQA
ncbi:hypothetical protein ACU8MP_29485 (plasmid) [Rhizobium leguminosarum]